MGGKVGGKWLKIVLMYSVLLSFDMSKIKWNKENVLYDYNLSQLQACLIRSRMIPAMSRRTCR